MSRRRGTSSWIENRYTDRLTRTTSFDSAIPEVGVEVEHGGEDEGGKDRDHHRHENIHVVRGEKGCHG